MLWARDQWLVFFFLAPSVTGLRLQGLDKDRQLAKTKPQISQLFTKRGRKCEHFTDKVMDMEVFWVGDPGRTSSTPIIHLHPQLGPNNLTAQQQNQKQALLLLLAD